MTLTCSALFLYPCHSVEHAALLIVLQIYHDKSTHAYYIYSTIIYL